MDSEHLQAWLDGSARGEFGALRPDIEILHALLHGRRSTEDAARGLVSDVSAEPLDPESDRAWRVWQLLLSAATELPQYHQALVELVIGILEQVPVNPAEGSDNRLVQHLWVDWRDHFDGLRTHRHLRQKYDAESVVLLSGSERYIAFSVFSAKLVNQGGATFVENIGTFAFFELRDVLEFTRDDYLRDTHLDEEVTTADGARSADLEAACQWITHGDRAILHMSNSALEGFEDGAAMPTDFWAGAPGLSEDRWRLWRERLGACLEEEGLNEGAKKAIRQAVVRLT